jgi:sulfur-oxidizing protein SoxY
MMTMTLHQPARRQFLKASGGASLLAAMAAAGMTFPLSALADQGRAAFDAKTLPEALKALGVDNAGASGDVQVLASDIAENGAVVPVQAVSKLAKTEQMAILVEKNPFILAANFDIGPDMIADVTTRIKMAQTSNVVVLVKADGKFYSATKEIKVTLGGCGG